MNKRLNRLAWLLFFLCLTSMTSRAQDNASPYDGSTPEGLERGGKGIDFVSVNLATGSLNFSLPLLTIGGRGKAGYMMRYTIDKRWAVERIACLPGSLCPDTGYELRVKDSDWNLIEPGFGPGVMVGRTAGKDTGFCAVNPKAWDLMVTHLSFIGPDGSETPFVDAAFNGEPKGVVRDCVVGNSRGTVWYSTDASGATFISNEPISDAYRPGYQFYPSGTLKWKDGTTYNITGGEVTRIIDTNGNYVDFIYTNHKVTRITDSLKRTVTIAYNTVALKSATISYKGYAGADRAITVTYGTAPSTWLRPDFTGTQTVTQAFPEFDISWLETPNIPIDGIGATQITMPDGRGYRLYYNNYAELARIDLPAGGKIEYDYGAGYNVAPSGANPTLGLELIYRRVKEQRVFKQIGDTIPVEVTRYRRDSATGPTVVDKLVPGSTQVVERTNHYHRSDPRGVMSPWIDPLRYPKHDGNKEYKTEYLASDGATVLRTVEYDYQPRVTYSWGSYDSQLRSVTTTLNDVSPNLVSRVESDYDNYNSVTQVRGFDFGAGAPGPLIRRTQTSYLTTNGNQGNVNYATDLNIHIRDLPVQSVIYDASGTAISQTDFIYDDYGAFPLVDRPGIVQHDGAFHAGYGARGNLTGVIHRNPGGSPSEVQLHNQCDIAGNMVKAVDGRGFATEYDFTDRLGLVGNDARSNAGAPELAGGFSYAFPTKVTSALGHTAYAQYDYYLGRPVNTEGVDQVLSSVAYNDALDRPTQRIQAKYVVGVGVPAVRRQTTFTYDDLNRIITITTDRDAFNDNTLAGKTYFDGLGRSWRSATREGSTWAITDTRFDAVGRVSQVSNPYRAADPGSSSPPPGLWTTTDYDALSRAIKVTTSDGAHVDTAYSGARVSVTDQAGKGRRSETDALGRLIEVVEDPSGLSYTTHYSYDALGNLRLVTQGAQTRTFAYDSLSRLISVANPEGGTLTYAYDPNGNLIEKTDARGVKTTMTYDALNRVRSKVYSGLTPGGTDAANLTHSVNYFYDVYSGLPGGAPSWPGTPSTGRLIGVTYGSGSEGTYYKYDAAGRIVTNHQRQGTSNYVTAYVYNLAGAITREDRGGSSLTRRRNWTYYDETGRVMSMQSGAYNGFDIEPHDLVSNISYTPFGALQSETYGNGLIHSMGYNSRLQPTEIRLGRLYNLESVFTIYSIFGTAYNVNGQDAEINLAHNNGNLARIKYSVSGTIQYTQTFQYDPLNRLRYALEHSNGMYNDAARAWYQTFAYDQFGNRGIDVANTSGNVGGVDSALQLADFSGANNHITRAGFVYDADGNLIEESGKRYTYDAEGRIVAATLVGGGTSQYFYDGNGRRVKKIVGGVATRFEYGAGGKLIAEWNDSDSNKVVQKDYFYKGGELFATTKAGTSGEYVYATGDHLGSPRAWTDDSGNLIAGGRHDYLPFGEELFAGYGVRTTSQGYAASAQQDGQRNQFGSQVRDIEIGLDYFGARYFAPVQGRFTSVDPLLSSGKPIEPQSWNRYLYVDNNPLIYIDTDGQIKRNFFGRIVFKKEGAPMNVGHGGEPGRRFKVQKGYITADNGTRIEAFKSFNKSAPVLVNSEGSAYLGPESKDNRFKCDCHGLTFADGKYWINNAQVDKLLAGDNYGRTDTPKVGDIAVYRDADGNVAHSVTVTKVDSDGNVTEVSGLGGLEMQSHSDNPTPGPGGAWPYADATVEYYTKSDDKRSDDRRAEEAGKIKNYKKDK